MAAAPDASASPCPRQEIHLGDATQHQVTGLLGAWREGNRQALDELLPLVYEELRRIARVHMVGERPDHTLQTTALVNEACVRLMGSRVEWQDRVHFYSVASRVMRRILVDHARAHRSAKRGGGLVKVALDDAPQAALQTAMNRPWDLLDLDRALTDLAEQDERKARVVELHFFGGMTLDEVAGVLDRTHDSVAWDLRLARAWLRRALSEPTDTGPPRGRDRGGGEAR